MWRYFSISILAVSVACTSPVTKEEDKSSDTLVVYSFSHPVSALVDTIGGPFLQNTCILPVEADAATWEPSIEQIIAMQKADLLVSNGFGFEGWVKTAALPNSKILEVSASIEPIKMQGKTHSHGKGGEHSHGEVDPHTWSDPLSYAMMAGVVSSRLTEMLPAHEDAFDVELLGLQGDLAELNSELSAILQTYAGRHLAANHPSFSYLLRRNGLEITNFDLDPEGESAATEIEKANAWAETHPNAILFWEKEPSEKAKTALPKFVHQYLDPVEAPEGGGYDYLGQHRRNVTRLQELNTALEQIEKATEQSVQ